MQLSVNTFSEKKFPPFPNTSFSQGVVGGINSFSLKTSGFCVTIFTFKIEDTRAPVTGMKYPIKNCMPSKQGRAEACLKLRVIYNV
jgi:hypothetical protein